MVGAALNLDKLISCLDIKFDDKESYNAINISDKETENSCILCDRKIEIFTVLSVFLFEPTYLFWLFYSNVSALTFFRNVHEILN